MNCKVDRNVVSFGSTDGVINIVAQMDELDIKALDEKCKTKGTHFMECYNARIFIRTEGGVLVLIPD